MDDIKLWFVRIGYHYAVKLKKRTDENQKLNATLKECKPLLISQVTSRNLPSIYTPLHPPTPPPHRWRGDPHQEKAKAHFVGKNHRFDPASLTKIVKNTPHPEKARYKAGYDNLLHSYRLSFALLQHY